MTTYHPLLDLPPFPADRYSLLADRLKTLLATRNDVVFVQAEAILALEAAATSLGRPGLVVVSIVTSPYGGYFGDWLRRAGGEVHTVQAEPGRPIAVRAVDAALSTLPRVDLVAMVHAETSSGILNPLPEIAALVRSRGALLVVDAVASVGGHALDVDALGIDVCAIGAQKALAGPTALSALSISPRAWAAMRPQPAPSSLSLLDLKANWLDRGRGVLPGMPAAIEFWALEAALDRVEAEGLVNVVARHARAAEATRSGVRALGIEPWETDPSRASALATAVAVPAAVEANDLIARARGFGAVVNPGFGKTATPLIRLDHTGQRARRADVLANIMGLGAALRSYGIEADISVASDVVSEAYVTR